MKVQELTGREGRVARVRGGVTLAKDRRPFGNATGAALASVPPFPPTPPVAWFAMKELFVNGYPGEH